MTTFLVTGATGFLGEHVIRRLPGSGSKVLAFVRPGSRTEWLERYGVEIRVGDLSHRAVLAHALQGVDVFLNIASLGFGHAADIVAASQSSGVERTVFVSSASVFTRLPAATKDVRVQAEKLIAKSGLNYTILRPTMIYGSPRDRNVWRLICYLRRWPVIPIVGRGDALQQPVFVEDVARAVVQASSTENAIGKVYNLGGAPPISFVQMIDIVCERLQRSVVKVYVAPRLARAFLSVFFRLGLRITPEQAARIEEDKVVDINAAVTDLHFTPLDFNHGLERELQWLNSEQL